MCRRSSYIEISSLKTFLLQADTVIIIDLGCTKKCRDAWTKQHIPYQEDKNSTGLAADTVPAGKRNMA